MKEPEFRASKTGASLVLAKKKIAIDTENGVATLNLTNEYGNDVSYSLHANQFEGLFAELWRFVKESQH